MLKAGRRLINVLPVVLLVISVFLSIGPQLSFAKTPAKIFDLIEITDFHGYLQNSGKLNDGTVIIQPRAAVIAKQLKDIKTTNPDTVILSGGDMFQGTPLSNVLKGQPVIAMMNNIGFDAMALGNHEYDWGIDTVIDTRTATLKNSAIPVLAANVYDKTTGKPVSYVKPYVMLKKDGINIGVIGMVDNLEFPFIIMPLYIQNVDFKDPVPIVNTLAAQLRAQGAKVVIVVAHMGAVTGASGVSTGHLIDFANKVTGVDAIFGGHTHTIVTTKVKGIPVGVANCYSQGFLDLKLTVNPDGKVTTGDMTYYNSENLYNVASPMVDPEVQAIVVQANQAVGPKFNEIIGNAATELTRSQSAQPYADSALGNWVAEVTRKTANADFGFANNGGLRIDIPKGNITVGEMFQLMPFDNTIITVKMTGEQLKILLEQAVQNNGRGIQVAGLSFIYDPTQPNFKRVIKITKSDGSLLAPNASYLVATNNYMGTGGDDFAEFTDPGIAKTYTDTYQLVRDALIEAVKAGKNITAAVDGRIAPGRKPETTKIKPVINHLPGSSSTRKAA